MCLFLWDVQVSYSSNGSGEERWRRTAQLARGRTADLHEGAGFGLDDYPSQPPTQVSSVDARLTGLVQSRESPALVPARLGPMNGLIHVHRFEWMGSARGRTGV